MAVTIDKVGGSSNTKHAEIFGKLSERPLTANTNDMFIALDTGDVYYWDGSWKVFGEQ